MNTHYVPDVMLEMRLTNGSWSHGAPCLRREMYTRWWGITITVKYQWATGVYRKIIQPSPMGEWVIAYNISLPEYFTFVLNLFCILFLPHHFISVLSYFHYDTIIL